MRKFELFPVGRIEACDEHSYVYIFNDYRPALKYLGLFSHALLFLKCDGEDKINRHWAGDCTAHDSIRRILRNNCVVQHVTAKILHIDEKKGIIEIDCPSVRDGVPVFDIKPYFPCEDRVRDVAVPGFLNGWSKWRIDGPGDKAFNTDIIQRLPEEEKKECYPINQKGIIRKTEGEYYLELNDSDMDLIYKIDGFSHVRILWWFERFDKSSYRRITEGKPPYENAPRTGIFATRSPVRPNPIALTTARVLDIDFESRRIKVTQLDAFDKTPIINVFPYIPALDRVRDCHVPDWLGHWPEWVDDRETDTDGFDVEILESDIKRITKYTDVKKTTRKSSKDGNKNYIMEESRNQEFIEVKGARQNNLKNLNCTIPKNKITVITGVSGSGKSSLAFDTIYAESQRRFLDCMSISGRGIFKLLDKPDFDYIAGLPPAIAIEQKITGKNPRSTVGTMTEVYDYLRLLFSRVGTRHCPECGRAVVPLKTDEIVNTLAGLRQGTSFRVYGFDCSEVMGEFFISESAEEYDCFVKRLKECVKNALKAGDGAITVVVNNTDEFVFQTREMCYHCKRIFFELTTSTFSFNNPESMCPVCKGLGVKLEVYSDLIVSNPDLSILDGASEWWGDLRKYRKKPNANWMRGEILALAEEMGVDLELPWKDLPEDFRRQALYGSGGRKVSFTYENSNGRRGEITRPVEGAYNSITRLFREHSGDTSNGIASAFMREKSCNVCRGERLAPEGRLVSLADKRFPETVNMTIEELRDWIDTIPDKLTEVDLEISAQILEELKKRLENLIDIGLPYLTLDRPVPTLSGGETQRLKLATQLGSGIANVLYVLDEPSIGLHPKDHSKLIKIMQKIRDEGNTVLVVEHDADTMLAADKIIDIGPRAGINGGMIIAEGSPEEIMQHPCSETGKYLRGMMEVSDIRRGSKRGPWGWITIKGARHNNLKNIDVSIPLGVLTCVTGVSGSGKSSLVSKTLYPALARLLNKSDDIPGQYDYIEGYEKVERIINISQQPIGRTPRSNPVTYTGVFDDIRKFFASLDEAKNKGYKSSKFSFNSREGQCEACRGEGRKCVEMYFMPDIWVECSACHGSRFNAEALEIKYRGKTIADVLDMNVLEALELFADNHKIRSVLQTLKDVGLGYIKLGQSALTLSGGEAQRVKLAKELSKADTGKTIYLLDEPTTGLHFSDVQNLLGIFQRITQAGNTVLVIEHNLDVIKSADWIIDLGPEGGKAGGYLVAQGTLEDVARVEKSHTGAVIRSVMSKSQKT